MTALSALFVRDLKLAVRVGGGAGIGVLFFLIVIVLTPFAIGPDLVLLARIGPAILWLGALLASLLTLERLDLLDGHLELMGDPGVGPPLADPCPDLVQLRLQRSACQTAPETTNGWSLHPPGKLALLVAH